MMWNDFGKHAKLILAIGAPVEKKAVDEMGEEIDVKVIAMEKFIQAIKDEDAETAAEAMQEFQEMCSGMEYVETE